MTAYYNEIDPFAAQWLRNLIDAGHIAPGVVDTRSIEEVTAGDVRGFTQCHFFAGIGVWSYALRRAGWPDNRPVWTGSCPCQPFSVSGSRRGFDDPRHLWPVWFRLIAQCRPGAVFGEQVASRDGLDWFDAVQNDLENAGYACAAADLCAAGVGAPHIRQRLYWVADADLQYESAAGNAARAGEPGRCGEIVGVAHANNERRQGAISRPGIKYVSTGRNENSETVAGFGGNSRAVEVNGFWRDADWLGCRDGRWRPVEPGTSPLANGPPARVGRLRAYGNAICAPLAETFIAAAMGKQ
jgi:DNA (cytosine-5)-methyltransferase 1